LRFKVCFRIWHRKRIVPAQLSVNEKTTPPWCQQATLKSLLPECERRKQNHPAPANTKASQAISSRLPLLTTGFARMTKHRAPMNQPGEAENQNQETPICQQKIEFDVEPAANSTESGSLAS